MSICLPRELEQEVVEFTDAGTWKCSWHWERDTAKAWSPITLRGAEQMLRDLNCESALAMGREIVAATRKIQARYALALRIRRIIDDAKVSEVADSHEDGCACEFCVAAGYVRGLLATPEGENRDAQTHE